MTETATSRPERIAYGVPRAADLLDVSPRTVAREIAAGRLSAVHVRRRLVIPADALRDYLEGSTR